MKLTEQTLTEAMNTPLGNYEITALQIQQIHQAAEGSAFRMITLAYALGFRRGQNSERNHRRKLAKLAKQEKATA